MPCLGMYHFGMNAIEQARVKKGWSRADLAKRIGVSVTQIGRWERTTRNIPDPQAAKLADALEINPFEIKPSFGGDLVKGLSTKNQRKFFDSLETLFLAQQAERGK